MTAIDSFTAPTETFDIPRDRWGRPLIVPTDGGDPVPYTRVSTLSSAVTDQSSLKKWYGRTVAAGMAKRPDLIAMAAVAGDDWKVLNDVAESAAEAAGAYSAASMGTALHVATEAADNGIEMSDLPAAVVADLAAYREATRNLTVIDTEQFVVVDELAAAGTYDRLVALPDGRVVIADLKTGREPEKYALATAIQVAAYAAGQRYNPTTGARVPIHPDLDPTVGLLIAMPAGTAKCRLFLLDAATGWRAAQHAVTVRKIRSWKKWAVPFDA